MKRLDALRMKQNTRTIAGRREALRVADLIKIEAMLEQIAGDVPSTPAQKIARDLLDALNTEGKP